MLESRDIQGILPHRYPFLMVDRVLEVEPGKKVVAIKNVTINEPFFVGHYPGMPVMPGVLIVEAVVQAAGIAAFGEGETRRGVPYFVGINRFRFRRPVVPGDQVRIEVHVVRKRKTVASVEGKAFVEGRIVADGEVTFMLVGEKTREEQEIGASEE